MEIREVDLGIPTSPASELQVRLVAAKMLAEHATHLEELELGQAARDTRRLINKRTPTDGARWEFGASQQLYQVFQDLPDLHGHESAEDVRVGKDIRDAALLLQLADRLEAGGA